MFQHSVFKRFINLFSVIVILHSYLAGEQICTGGKEIIFVDFDLSVEQFLPEVFIKDFCEHLKSPLEDIGYCLQNLNRILAETNERKNSMIMSFSVKMQTEQTDTFFNLQVDLIKTSELREGQQSQSNSFISLSFDLDELNTVETVLIRKIVENLRMQYVCHLRIRSSPESVFVKTETGLEGVTPLEWIVPVGQLSITGELKGYEPCQRLIDIGEPGVHTFHLQMQKRKFYRSKLMFPAGTLLLTSAVCFISERYYYNSYHRLSKEELEQHPEHRKNTYGMAKKFGAFGTAAFILSCISFSFTFRF